MRLFVTHDPNQGRSTLMIRLPQLTAIVLSSLLLAAVPAQAWGPSVHQEVTSRAIDTLPAPLKAFYKTHRLEIPSLSPEAEVAPEDGSQRFALDRLLPFPFTDLPRKEEAFTKKFTDAGADVGRLPWLIFESYERLVTAFKSGDKAQILAESDTLSALVSNIHNPLALTDNYDGQKTGQHGVYVRFSVKLPEIMDKRLKLDPDAAHYLDDPRDYVFGMMNGAYIWVDNLLFQEDLAHRGKSGYTEIYYEAFEQRASPILRERLSRATGDVGSYWYTAWTAAGKPALK
jgi:hypothetical protein